MVHGHKPRGSLSIGEASNNKPFVSSKDSVISLDELLNIQPKCWKRTAYYYGISDNGMRQFGLDGTAKFIQIPEEVYKAIGEPPEDKDVPISLILEKAGYVAPDYL